MDNQSPEDAVGLGLVTVRAAGEFLSVSRSMLYGMMDSGKLQYVKIGRARRIPQRSLIDLAARSLTVASQ